MKRDGDIASLFEKHKANKLCCFISFTGSGWDSGGRG